MVVEIVSLRKVRLAIDAILPSFPHKLGTRKKPRLGGGQLIERNMTILARITVVIVMHHHHNQSSQGLQTVLQVFTEVRMLL